MIQLLRGESSQQRESGKEGKGGKPGLFSVKEAKGMARRRDINRVQSCREFVNTGGEMTIRGFSDQEGCHFQLELVFQFIREKSPKVLRVR